MGTKRSQEAVCKKLKRDRSMISAWAGKFKWTDRVITWHHEQAEIERAAQEKAALEKARERERRKDQVQDSAWEMFQALRAKVTAMLQFPVARQTVTKDVKGKTITTIIEPIRWRFSDVARVAEVADGLARLSTGMSTSNGRLTVQDPMGRPLPPPVQTLIQINVTRSKEANTEHAYKTLPGEPDEEDEEKQSALG
jgi:hypothetical protein